MPFAVLQAVILPARNSIVQHDPLTFSLPSFISLLLSFMRFQSPCLSSPCPGRCRQSFCLLRLAPKIYITCRRVCGRVCSLRQFVRQSIALITSFLLAGRGCVGGLMVGGGGMGSEEVLNIIAASGIWRVSVVQM